MEYVMDKVGGWSQQSVLVAVMIILATVWFSVLARSRALRRRLPPGPRGWPVVGSLFSLGNAPHITWQKLTKKYGPIMSMTLGKQPMVIVNSPELAKEVLKTKDSITANRPDKTIAAKTMYAKEGLVWSKLGPTWRTMRRLCFTQLLTTRSLQNFQSVRKTEIRTLIHEVLNQSQRNGGKPVNITQLAQRLTFNNITQMIMGRRLMKTSSTSAENVDDVGKQLFVDYIDVQGTANISDFIPFLRPLDLQGIKKRAIALGQQFEKYLQTLVDDCHKSLNLADSVMKGTFVEQLIKLQPQNIPEKERVPQHEYLTDEQIKGVVLDLTIGGTDTSSTMLDWCLAELAKNPHMMKRVQAELENVVGRDRLVEEADISKLSYLQAVVKEALRLHPATPYLAPHYTTEDCELGGYSIPAKTQVQVNTWAIHRDPAVWERPLEFDPDRFLGSNIDVGGQSFKYLPFGSGRRICPGMELGMLMIHYPLAQLVHSFEWNLPYGQKPEDMDMTGAGTTVYHRAEELILVPKLRLPVHVI